MRVLCELFGFVICGYVTGKGRAVMGGTVEVGNYIHIFTPLSTLSDPGLMFSEPLSS